MFNKPLFIYLVLIKIPMTIEVNLRSFFCFNFGLAKEKERALETFYLILDFLN